LFSSLVGFFVFLLLKGILFLFFAVLGIELRGLMHAWQGLYQGLAMLPALLFIFWFWDRVLLTLPRLASNLHPPDFTSQIAGIIGMHHHSLLLLLMCVCFI
jgi:hypothetical protein